MSGFARLHDSLEHAALALERQSRFAQCLRLVIERCTESPPTTRTLGCAGLGRARDLIHDRCSEEISLDELARAAGVGRFHLVRAFSRELGLPPHAYQIKLRIARAKTLLRAGLPAAQVADELGFADQSHFIRHFHRVIGVTPRAYVLARS